MGYSEFLISCIDWRNDIRIDGIKKVFNLLSNNNLTSTYQMGAILDVITFKNLVKFFRRRLVEVQEHEFNEL
jgi:hypothetical protein